MKGSSQRQCLVLVWVVIGLTASISTAVPVPGADAQVKRVPKSFIDQLYGTTVTNKSRPDKRASPRAFGNMAVEPEYMEEKVVAPPANPMDEVFGMLTTEELLRMLELLDMLEHNKPIYASENELATLAYLLKSTRGSGMTSSY